MKKLVLIFSIILLMLAMGVSAELQLNSVSGSQDTQGGNSYTASIKMTHFGNTPDSGLIELAFFKPGSLASVSGQSACNVNTPWNVHRTYYANVLSSFTINLHAQDIPQGTYDVVITHVDKCCTDGVNSFSCGAKQPFGWHTKIGQITVGNPVANVNDQCDTDYTALQYLKNHGDLSCISASCQDGPSSSSKAVCVLRGECNVGGVQSQNCPDGSVVNVRQCSYEAKWVSTGQTCSDPSIPIPGEPPSVGSPPSVDNVGIILIVLLGLAGAFFGFAFAGVGAGVAGGVVGLIIGFVIMMVI